MADSPNGKAPLLTQVRTVQRNPFVSISDELNAATDSRDVDKILKELTRAFRPLAKHKYKELRCRMRLIEIAAKEHYGDEIPDLLVDEIEELNRTILGWYVQTVKVKKQYIPSRLRWKVWERDNYTCQKCKVRTRLSIDHIIPESKGGKTIEENLQTLCRSCNARKHDRFENF